MLVGWLVDGQIGGLCLVDHKMVLASKWDVKKSANKRTAGSDNGR